MNQEKADKKIDNNKAIRKLSRTEILELLIDQMKENERLKAKLNEAEKKLADRTISIENSGSIAEAALKISGIFEGFEWVDKYMQAIENGNYWISSSGPNSAGVYTNIDGTVKQIFILATSDYAGSTQFSGYGNYMPEITGLEFDRDTGKLTVKWTCYSSEYSQTEYPTLYNYINFGNDIIQVDTEVLDNLSDAVYDSIFLSVTQDASQVVHYSYSDDQSKTASFKTDYRLVPGELTFTKSYVAPVTTAKYMGASFEYTITASKKDGQPSHDALRYIVDDLPVQLFINDSNMRKMFYDDPYGEYLTVYITNATLCKPLSGAKLDSYPGNSVGSNTEYCLPLITTAEQNSSYTGLVTALTNHVEYTTGNTIVITIGDCKSQCDNILIKK